MSFVRERKRVSEGAEAGRVAGVGSGLRRGEEGRSRSNRGRGRWQVLRANDGRRGSRGGRRGCGGKVRVMVDWWWCSGGCGGEVVVAIK